MKFIPASRCLWFEDEVKRNYVEEHVMNVWPVDSVVGSCGEGDKARNISN
jgi:hypothetical protein